MKSKLSFLAIAGAAWDRMKTHSTQHSSTRSPIHQPGYALLFLLTAIASQAALVPLGTDFTYQGRLNDARGAANGRFDFTFGLYDAGANGSRFAAITNLNVAVSNGLFTTSIDFGSGIFTGYAFWMEIGVR